MKPLIFVGRSLEAIRTFPDGARRETGYQLSRIEAGLEPTDWKPMATVSAGVREIRIQAQGAFRVIYVDSREEAIYVLHAFLQKTQKTEKRDIELAKERLKQIRGKRT